MADKSCIHCGKPAESANVVDTRSGPVHEGCWAAFTEEKPVAKPSAVAGCFGLSMIAGGSTVLAIGLAALAMGSALHTADAQNPLVGIPAAIMWFIAMAVAYSAIPAGAIMLSIAFFTWVVTNNNTFKNYVAGGVAAMALAVFVVGPQLVSWVNTHQGSKPSSNHELQSIDAECKALSSSHPLTNDVGQVEIGLDAFHCRGVVIEWYANGQKKSEATYGDPIISKEYRGKWLPRPRKPNQMPQGFLIEVREGQLITWHPNGQKQLEGSFVDNQHNGTWTEWFANGQIKSLGNYVDGRRDGLWRGWYDNGQIQWEDLSYHASIVSDTYPFRKLAPVRDGTDRASYLNGQLEKQVTYLDGKVVGNCVTWRSDGTIYQDGGWRCISAPRFPTDITAPWHQDFHAQ